MTTDELAKAKAADLHDVINNEGGEGYNPYRDELARRAHKAAAEQPATRATRKAQIIEQLERKDCSIARESGTHNQGEIDTLRTELAQIEADEKAEFQAEWTKAETEVRKARWNKIATKLNPGRKLNAAEMRKYMAAVEAEAGFTLADLKKAVAMYK